MSRCLKTLLAVLSAWTACQLTLADTLQPGFLEFSQLEGDRWRLFWKPPLQTANSERIVPVLPASCEVHSEHIPGLVDTRSAQAWTLDCPPDLSGQQIGIEEGLVNFTEVILRIGYAGEAASTHRLTRDSPVVALRAANDRQRTLPAYVELGYEHILVGYDHILFVLCLVLLVRNGWQIVKTVTAFTIAHSITLALSTQGWLQVERSLVEILIALSIVVLAAEVQQNPREKLSMTGNAAVIAAFMFGLLHGLGFAGALAEIGLPDNEQFIALLGFNIGVEIGQLAIVAVILTCGWLTIRLLGDAFAQRLSRAASYTSGMIGAFWVFERLLG